MRRWLGALGIALCVGLGAPASAQAVFFAAYPATVQRDPTDLTTVTVELYFHADGHTAGAALIDLYLELSDPSMYATINPTTVGNTTLGAGSSILGPDGVLFTASDIMSLLPTPTGAEVIKLGELEIVHAGIEGPLDIMLDPAQTVIFDTLSFDTQLTPTNDPSEILATIEIGPLEPAPPSLPVPTLTLWGLATLLAALVLTAIYLHRRSSQKY
jgi:hypothetical protein